MLLTVADRRGGQFRVGGRNPDAFEACSARGIHKVDCVDTIAAATFCDITRCWASLSFIRFVIFTDFVRLVSKFRYRKAGDGRRCFWILRGVLHIC